MVQFLSEPTAHAHDHARSNTRRTGVTTAGARTPSFVHQIH
jgi:hypothetical protein